MALAFSCVYYSLLSANDGLLARSCEYSLNCQPEQLREMCSLEKSASETKSIHLFLLLVAMALSEFRKGILCMLIPFTGSATLSHRAATHLSGIFRVYSKTLDGIQVRSL